MFTLNPSDIEKAAKSKDVARSELIVPSSIILTFNRAIVEELTELCDELKEWKWKAEMFSPYSSSRKSFKGLIDNLHDIAVFMPPMGASPIVAFSEELIYFGAKYIFLICSSWGLGEKYLSKGQIHLPNFAMGIDGTSIHYGNKNYNVIKEPKAYNALITALNKLGVNWKEGGVGACEAIYCITLEMIEEYRKQGCLSMENGEVASLFSLAHKQNTSIGVLLQPYVDLEKGWSISYFDDEYTETCKIQARAAIEALKILHQMR